MNILKATLGEAAALSRLAVESVAPHKEKDFDDHGWERFVASNAIPVVEQRLQSAHYLCFYAELQDQVAGFITLRDFEKIDQLFVNPRFQNLGVARALWEHAKRECLEVKEPECFWVRSSTMAVPVYRRFGFVEVGERKTENGISYQLMKR